MDPIREHAQIMTRRHLLGRCATGIGTAALASLLAPDGAAQASDPDEQRAAVMGPIAYRRRIPRTAAYRTRRDTRQKAETIAVDGLVEPGGCRPRARVFGWVFSIRN